MLLTKGAKLYIANGELII